MTVKEAINQLQDAKDGYQEYLSAEIIDMAIKALEQEPILDKIRTEIEEKYGNYIICELFENYDYEENDISEYQYIGDVSDILAIIDKYKAESEEQEPRKGHWIEHEQNGIAYIECSECLTWFLRCHLLRNTYCPNCGCRMVEPQESEGQE